MITEFVVGNLPYPTVLNCLIVGVLGDCMGGEQGVFFFRKFKMGRGGCQNKMTLQNPGDENGVC